MTLQVLLYRPYQSHFKAFVYDGSGIGKNLLAGRSLTSAESAEHEVVDRLMAKYGKDIKLEFTVREGERGDVNLKYQLPSGKVVTVR